MKKTVGIIFGGRSEEHEVSIMSAKSIAANIDRNKYGVRLYPIDKGGRPYSISEEDLDEGRVFYKDAMLSFGQFADSLRNETDVVFPVIHGPYGEDGRLQGFLDMLSIRYLGCGTGDSPSDSLCLRERDLSYVGCGTGASCVCMDKAYSKLILKQKGFKLVPFMVVTAENYRNGQSRAEILKEAEKLVYPLFVKPANLGSSVGISKAKNEEELKAAIELAFSYDRKILIEHGIDARELECGVIGRYELTPTAVGEIVPSKEFYDYEAKYSDNCVSDLIIPAKISDADARFIMNESVRACTALDVCGFARVDFLMDKKSGDIYLSEINTIPGFTKYSMYPRLAESIGYSYPELIDKLIEIAFE